MLYLKQDFPLLESSYIRHTIEPHMLAASTGSSNSSKYIYYRQPLLIVVLRGCSSGSSSVGTVGSCGGGASGAVGCLWGCRVILGLWWASELCVCVWGGWLWDCGGPLELWRASGAMGNLDLWLPLWMWGTSETVGNFGVPRDCGWGSEL